MGAGKCYGQATGGGQGALGGGQQGLGLGQLGQIISSLGGLIGALGGGGGSGGGSGGAFPSYAGCTTQYYYTSNNTEVGANPCAIYQPGASALLGDTTIQSGLASDLLNALGIQTPVSGSLTNTPTTGTQVSVSQTKPGIGSTTTVQEGLTGNVRLNPDATVFANLRKGITEVAGFFGGSTFGGSQSALSRLCSARPWATNNFLGSLSPDGFFDGLCRAAGYQVGQVQQQTGGAQQQTSFATGEQTTPSVATSTGPYVEPKADIRAEPLSVRLGTRTYVFWTSQGVTACAVRGPNFMQDTLQGAGATVPITGATTYTISCTAPDGRTVNDTVTVQLAI